MKKFVRLILWLPLLVMCISARGDEPRPNVLLIMIDDLGWMDLRCQGNPRLETPNIDKLAAEGMRFTDAYAAAPVCSPTRAAVLTGLSPARLRITNHIPDSPRFAPRDAKLMSADTRDHLPVEHVTIAERLRTEGYATGFFGKWHLAGSRVAKGQGQGDMRFYPEQHGFDVNVGGCAIGGPFSFFDPYNIHNLPDRNEGEYMPDRLADEVIAFMRDRGSRPFLCFLWNYTVHWPMEAPQSLVEKYQRRGDLDGVDPRYAAMIEAMDAATGRILDALDEMQLSRETLIIFTSDNGAFGGVADNRPLRAAKGHLYEGGIRVPLIIRWPGKVPSSATCDTPVISMDFYPTILDAIGTTAVKNLDGESLMPLMRQGGRLSRDAIFFHYPNYAFHGQNRLGSAIRVEDYKLIERFDDGSVELYDLRHDVGETRNLASEMPERAKSMQEKLSRWRRETGAAMPER